MNKKKLIYSCVMGLVVGVFIIQPLIILLFLFDKISDHGNFLDLIKISFGQLSGVNDFDQILSNLLFAVLGICLMLILVARKRIFRLKILRPSKKKTAEIIDFGENQFVEFKSTVRWDLRLEKINRKLELVVVKTISGFMNAKGENLFLGVSDKGDVLGLEMDFKTLKKPGKDAFEQYIMQMISFKLGTNFCSLVQVYFIELDGKEICHLVIKKAKNPVYLNIDDHSFFFIRTGNGTRELDINEAFVYIRNRFSHKLFKIIGT